MTDYKRLSCICGCLFLGLFWTACKNNGDIKNRANGEWVHLSAKAIPVDSGWGYEIFAGDKLYIKQDRVPQIGGNHYFLTEEDALRAANVVIKKLKQNPLPTIDTSELQAAGARYK